MNWFTPPSDCGKNDHNATKETAADGNNGRARVGRMLEGDVAVVSSCFLVIGREFCDGKSFKCF